MNKELLLGYILEAVDEAVEDTNSEMEELQNCDAANIDEYVPRQEDLNSQILELYSRREKACVYPPADMPKTAEGMITALRRVYRDDVSKISLVLHHYFPDQFLFYRVSKLEREILQGFEFFSEIFPELHFPFDRLKRNAFDDYLFINDRLRDLAIRWWPDAKNLQFRIHRFLYDNLAFLFLETSEYNRYWICGTHYGYWKGRYEEDENSTVDGIISWSGRKDMRADDLVFLYCAAPVKAITDIYYVQNSPRFDPYGGWHGHRI